MYHWFCVVSNWIGCPVSPGFLSDTRLTMLNVPPLLLISNGWELIALVCVCAILIWSVPTPAVIA